MTVQAASPAVATPAQRYIVTETLVGIVINVLMAGVVCALTNRAEAFNGATLSYVASDMAKATIIPILAFGTGLTLATRKRVGVGAVAGLDRPVGVWMPRNIVLRLVLLTALSLLLLGAPATLALHGLAAARSLTPLGLMLFKLTYGVIIGVVVTPVVLALALCDRAARRRA